MSVDEVGVADRAAAAARSPLAGIRVLDLTRVFAGPFVGRMLSDLGADVVKVETPEGDVTRTYGNDGPESTYFRQQNAGKRAITIDLREGVGVELLRALAAQADVVLENFRPGVLARHRLDWTSLSAGHPDLVMLSISGFGQEGPERDRATYAGVIHAEAGMIARQPQHAGRPTDVSLSVADAVSGLHGCIAVLAALRQRDATGVGQHIDLAMLDAMLFTDDFIAGEVAAAATRDSDAPVAAYRSGNAEIIDAPGGPMIVMGEFRWVWKCIHERLGVADPTPAGADLSTKIAARRRAWLDWVASFDDRAALIAALDRANLAWGVVRTGGDALQSPTVRHRRTIVEVPDADGVPRTVTRAPYRFSAARCEVRGPAPRRDEHRTAILSDWLGR